MLMASWLRFWRAWRKPRGLWPDTFVKTRVGQFTLRRIGDSRLLWNVSQTGRDEHVPRAGGVIIAGNHTSLLDAPVLFGLLKRNVIAVAAAGLGKIPLLGREFRRFGPILVARKDPVSRDKTYEAMVAHLRAGAQLLIFPEGRIMPDYNFGEFRLGAVKASRETGVPIVPFGIDGARQILPVHMKWREALRHLLQHPRSPIVVCFGEPLNPADYESAEAMNDALKWAVRELCDDAIALRMERGSYRSYHS